MADNLQNPSGKSAGSMMKSSTLGTKVLIGAAFAAVLATVAVIALWSGKDEYRVLFSNFADKDGGAIVAALEQMNVPYKYSEGGTAILVPSDKVHDARLKLASQGLPKGGNIGFEILEKQKFGVSQFVEQVNYHRALEGELERSIQSISSVQTARVHLAIPKNTGFVREQKKPSASVMLNLHPGRTLDEYQVSAIVHLVSSSIQEMPTSAVTVVDQNGSLLTDGGKKPGKTMLDADQLRYVNEIQENIASRVESIIAPLVGKENVHAEASADIDFSVKEQADELYKPNLAPEASAVRSQNSNETTSYAPNYTGGIPGAVSNQPTPPSESSAVIGDSEETGGAGAPLPNTEKNVTTNYEVDKTIKYTQQSMGGVKRLTVAVVVNNKTDVDAKGNPITRPLTDDEKQRINDLAKQAMGFNAERGDTLTVVNQNFAGEPKLPEVEFWKTPQFIDMAMQWAKILGGLVLLIIIWLKILKPMLNKINAVPAVAQLPQADGREPEDAAVVTLSGVALEEPKEAAYKTNLEVAKRLSQENPKLVASVISNWVKESN